MQQAAEQVDVQQIEKNLADSQLSNQQHRQQIKEPKNLTDEQKTPFIDEDIRTDK